MTFEEQLRLQAEKYGYGAPQVQGDPLQPDPNAIPIDSVPVDAVPEVIPTDIPPEAGPSLRDRLARAYQLEGVMDAGSTLVEGLTGGKSGGPAKAGSAILQKRIDDEAKLKASLAKASGKPGSGYKFAKVVDKNSTPLYSKDGESGFFRQDDTGKFVKVNPKEVNYPASMSTEKKMMAFKDSGYVDEEGQPLLRQEKTGEYFGQNKEKYTGTKFPKSFIERLVKEPGTELTPTRLSYLKDTSKAFDSRVKTVESSIQSANEIKKEINRDGKMTLNVIRTKMPRLFGEVGNLNEFEQKVWQGSPELMNRLKTLFNEKFDPNKTLEERDKKEFLAIIDIAMEAKNDLLQTVSEKYVTRAQSFGIPEALSRKHYISGVKPDIKALKKEAKPITSPAKETDLDKMSDEELEQYLKGD